MLQRLFLDKFNADHALATGKGRLKRGTLVAPFACVETAGTVVGRAESLQNRIVDYVLVVEVSPSVDVDLSKGEFSIA